MLPQRVPMTSPSKGVKPMVVSTEWPPRMAVMLAPLPKWQVISLRSAGGFFRNSAPRAATKLWLVPWKP